MLSSATAGVFGAALTAGVFGDADALVAATVNGPKGAIEGAHQTTALDTNDQLFNAAQYGDVIIALFLIVLGFIKKKRQIN